MKINIAVVRLSKGKKEVFIKEKVEAETTSPSGNFYCVEVKEINFSSSYSVLNCVEFNGDSSHCIGLLPAKELLGMIERELKNYFENNIESAKKSVALNESKIEVLDGPAVEFEKDKDED